MSIIPVSPTYRAIGFWGIIALVCLRVTIGWHFYMEGVTKVREGGFSSVGFLGAAKGPLAKNFQEMLPDYDGLLRLDRDKMVAAYQSYFERVKNTYSFNEEQRKEAEIAVNDAILRWDSLASPVKMKFYSGKNQPPVERRGEWASQIDEYKQGFERIKEMANDPKRSEVESLRAQRDEVEAKWRGLVKPVLAEIDKSGQILENQLSSIATISQKRNKGAIPFDLGGGLVSVGWIDKFIPIFDMSVGILLILGLLTPIAGLAAGLFLASVVLAQFPGFPGTQPTYFQAVEMVACFVLAFTDAGRFAGLDFLPWAFWNARAAKKASYFPTV